MKLKRVFFELLILMPLFLFANNCFAQFTFYQGVAQTVEQGTKTVRLLGEVKALASLSRYGGDLTRKQNTTGYFRIQQVEGVWYIIDPEGYQFFTVGVNSVSKGGGIALPNELWNIKANTLGCWSDETINSNTAAKMPFTPRWNFMLTYKNVSQRTKDLYNKGIIPVFDPAYVSFCDSHAKQLASSKNDPYLLGHFSDNELPIYDNTTYGNLLDRFLAIADKSDPNFLAVNYWMVTRKGQNYTITDIDRELFHGYLCGTYYKITSEAIKKYDPNHLYLGSRLHGGALSKPSIYIEAGKYVDIISINCYNTWTPSKSSMDMWSAGGKPFFITEFYAKAEDSGLTNESGAGWLVKTQDDRAKFFENFTLALIEHPGCVGYHHFRYMDDVDSNKGLISATYKWYEPLKSSFLKVGKDIYNLREFMINKSTGMTTPVNNRPVQFYPNPTSGTLQINGLNHHLPFDLEIYSSAGTLLDKLNLLNYQSSIDLKMYPSGLYFIKIWQGNHLIKGKIIKSNHPD